jgi:hypothetical protein
VRNIGGRSRGLLRGYSIGYIAIVIFIGKKSFAMSVKAFEFVPVIETLQLMGEKAQTKVMGLNMVVNGQKCGYKCVIKHAVLIALT